MIKNIPKSFFKTSTNNNIKYYSQTNFRKSIIKKIANQHTNVCYMNEDLIWRITLTDRVLNGNIDNKICKLISEKALEKGGKAPKYIEEVKKFFIFANKLGNDQVLSLRVNSAENSRPLLSNEHRDIDKIIKEKYIELLNKIMWINPRTKKPARFKDKDIEIKDNDEGRSRAYLILTTWGISNWGSTELHGGGAWVMGHNTESESESKSKSKSKPNTCPHNPRPFYRRLFEKAKGNIPNIPIYEEEPPPGGDAGGAVGEAGEEVTTKGGGKKKSRKKKSKKKKTKKKKSRKNKSRKNKKK